MQDDLRDAFCIDLDEAFKWMGFTRKDVAWLLLKWLVLNIDYAVVRTPLLSTVEPSERFETSTCSSLRPSRSWSGGLQLRSRTAADSREKCRG